MVTELQIQANCTNAQLSTGPKDTSKTRFNALKHGLLAKAVIVPRTDNEQDLQDILNALVEEYRPTGFTEEVLTERIAVAYWRLQRAIKTETGCIQQKQDAFLLKSPPTLFDLAEEAENKKNEKMFAAMAGVIQKPTQENEENKQKRERLTEGIRRLTNSVPTESDADRILRYETAIERQFYRALNELQKTKTLRCSEKEPDFKLP